MGKMIPSVAFLLFWFKSCFSSKQRRYFFRGKKPVKLRRIHFFFFAKSNRKSCHRTLRLFYLYVFVCVTIDKKGIWSTGKTFSDDDCNMCNLIPLSHPFKSKIASNYRLWKWKKRRFKSFAKLKGFQLQKQLNQSEKTPHKRKRPFL